MGNGLEPLTADGGVAGSDERKQEPMRNESGIVTGYRGFRHSYSTANDLGNLKAIVLRRVCRQS